MNETTKEHTMKQVHIPHTDCDHPKTPKARAVCRRLRRQGAPETSKAEIVARVKGAKVKKSTKVFSSKLGETTEVARLLKLEEDGHDVHVVDVQDDDDVEWVDDEDGHYDIVTAEVPSPMHGKDATLTIIHTIQAKGSKVVHARVSGGGVSMFACTKKVAKDDAQLGVVESAHLITCKNCLKLSNK